MIKNIKQIFAILVLLSLVAFIIMAFLPEEKKVIEQEISLKRPSTQQEIRNLDLGIVRLWYDSESSPQSATEIAKIYFENINDNEKAMEWIEYSNSIVPTAENSRQACIILQTMKKFEESISWCTQGHELGDDLSLLGIALAYRGVKNYEEALKWFHLANEKQIPDSANGLGLVYSEMKDYVNAEKWFLQAMKDDPKNTNALNNLVYFYIVDLNNKILGAAYAIASVNNVFPAHTIARFLLVTHKIPLEDLQKAYEFQLNNPILPYKFIQYESDFFLGFLLNEKGYKESFDFFMKHPENQKY